MADDDKKPDPVEDLKKGLGLLFRAAKTAVDKLPSDKLENIVVSGVKEVGRAIESVTDQIDRQVFGGKGTIPHPPAPPQGTPAPSPAPEPIKADAAADHAPRADEKAGADEKKDDAKDDPIDPDEEPPRGPRVA